MKDILIGIDAGTSVIKSVAFTLDGQQLAVSAVPNRYFQVDGGGVEQDQSQTWLDTVTTLLGLQEQLPDLKNRVAAISVTGQGDGTWLIDSSGEPVTSAWLWLDARAGQLVDDFRASEREEKRFEQTGTGFAACQQGAQMMWMQRFEPQLLDKSATAFHCKDWLFYNLTGQRVTDPSEGCFTFGNFRTREYSDKVLDLLELQAYKHLLPPMIEGVEENIPLSLSAAKATGLAAGTPVVLGYVDVICTALGAGLYDTSDSMGCTIVGSTGIHMRLVRHADNVTLNPERTGFTMPMPIPDVYAQMQSNMSSTLNIDWLLDMAVDLLAEHGLSKDRAELLPLIDNWLDKSTKGDILYQPYISEAGERGPFIDSSARAGFIGLSTRHRFPDLVRSVIEGLAFAAKDCYSAMGSVPEEIRLTGGAARSASLRKVFGEVLGADLRSCHREEAGAAGAAMMAAVSIGHYESMDACTDEWVNPLLGEREPYENSASKHYDTVFPQYLASRKALRPVWRQHIKQQGKG